MKKYFVLILGIVLFIISSCKKDRIEIDVEKRFSEKGVTTADRGYAATSLTLKPDGTASFLYWGDIYAKGTYVLKGNKITLSANGYTFKFTVKSETQILYDSDNPIFLTLVEK